MNLVELNTLALASGPNVAGLKTFFQGDGIYLISVIVAIYVIKSFKDANWLKIGSVLAMYAIVVSLLKGQQILSFLGGLLRWFGVETGL
ncbi:MULTISPECIES: hypothetical protein [Streptococcus]|uniref:hypothetical protein n=1 Tax=Streptococcus TaxID=1301 RepID=UPI00062035CC|nr:MULTISPECIES: hypothetical protein [Streptococcus]KKF45211.1 hypothetical protein AF61_03750 [Streptococcus uberis EF20/0145]PNY21703.1 hypothetical protein ASN88_01037 [Streptococcus parauberis]RFE01419.1 hypothetical protein ADO06_01332 [Streptococcus parauberis]